MCINYFSVKKKLGKFDKRLRQIWVYWLLKYASLIAVIYFVNYKTSVRRNKFEEQKQNDWKEYCNVLRMQNSGLKSAFSKVFKS